MPPKTHPKEIWAQLILCQEDAECLRTFFVEVGLPSQAVARRPHITVYHSRRLVPGVRSYAEPADATILAADTRFMVLAPGGENPRDDLDPARRKVGIRIRKPARGQIQEYRSRLIELESPEVFGSRRPSTRTRSAFGARMFQPHMTLLQPGSGIDRDLTKIGRLFRRVFVDFWFDRFVVIVADSRRNRATARAAT